MSFCISLHIRLCILAGVTLRRLTTLQKVGLGNSCRHRGHLPQSWVLMVVRVVRLCVGWFQQRLSAILTYVVFCELGSERWVAGRGNMTTLFRCQFLRPTKGVDGVFPGGQHDEVQWSAEAR